MRKNQSARVFGGMILLSWLTIPFIGRQHIKRYLSSAMFISFLIIIESYIAEKKKWWIFPNPPHPYLTGEAALLLGPFWKVYVIKCNRRYIFCLSFSTSYEPCQAF